MKLQNNTYIIGSAVRHLLCIAGLCMAMAGTLSVVGCSNDDAAADAAADRGDQLQLLPFMQPMTDVLATRAVTTPAGYVAYNNLYPQANAEYATIKMFLTTGTTELATTGEFIYQGEVGGSDQWESLVYVQENQAYHLYGFMPSEMAASTTLSPLNGDYTTGVVINITNMNILSPTDPCVVVGVEDLQPVASMDGAGFYENEGVITITGNGTVNMGEFSYTGKKKRRNFVRLLLDHIYAGVHFKFVADDDYSALRTIHLRKIEFMSDIGSTICCDITMVANSSNLNPLEHGGSISFHDQVNGSSSAVIFNDDKVIPSAGTVSSDPTKELSILGSFTPAISGIGDGLSIRVWYDVYDADDELLIRENCCAENQLPAIPDMSRGQKHTLTVTVNPTYLYQLGDPDLDNPTLTLSATP